MGKHLNNAGGDNVSGDICEATLASPGKWSEVPKTGQPMKLAIPLYEVDLNT